MDEGDEGGPAAGVSRAGSHPPVPWPVLAGVALGVTAVVLVLDRVLPGALRQGTNTDYDVYYRSVAQRIASGHGITRPDGSAAVRFPVGFPLLLAAPVKLSSWLGVGLAAVVRAFCAATSGLTAAVLYLLHRERFGGRAASLGLAAWLTYPILLAGASTPNVELPFMLVLALLAVVISRGLDDPHGFAPVRRPVVAGVLIGAAALLRPNGAALVVPVGLAIWWASSGRRARRLHRSPASKGARIAAVAVVAGVALAVVTPWVAWASHASGSFVPLSTGGPSTAAAGLVVGAGHRSEESGRTWFPAAARRFARRAAHAELSSTGDVARFWAGEAAHRPGEGLAMLATKAARSWYGTDSLRHDDAIALVQLPYVVLMGWGLVAAARRAGAGYAGFVASTIVVFWAVTIAAVSIAIYLSPALALAVWLVPFGPMGWWERRSTRAGPSSGAAADRR